MVTNCSQTPTSTSTNPVIIVQSHPYYPYYGPDQYWYWKSGIVGFVALLVFLILMFRQTLFSE